MSYNAAGVLAHMTSDGQAAWTIKHPERFLYLQISQSEGKIKSCDPILSSDWSVLVAIINPPVPKLWKEVFGPSHS